MGPMAKLGARPTMVAGCRASAWLGWVQSQCRWCDAVEGSEMGPTTEANGGTSIGSAMVVGCCPNQARVLSGWAQGQRRQWGGAKG